MCNSFSTENDLWIINAMILTFKKHSCRDQMSMSTTAVNGFQIGSLFEWSIGDVCKVGKLLQESQQIYCVDIYFKDIGKLTHSDFGEPMAKTFIAMPNRMWLSLRNDMSAHLMVRILRSAPTYCLY